MRKINGVNDGEKVIPVPVKNEGKNAIVNTGRNDGENYWCE